MKLIIGLGNYPEKYKYTRHNIGFLAIDLLCEKFGFTKFKSEKKFFGLISEGNISEEKILLCKPETYMNLSGKAVRALVNFYKLSPKDVYVIQDDLDMDFETVKYKEKGSSGGHNGIISIIDSLGTQEFSRVKFGIANAQKEKIPGERFVLMEFSGEEKQQLNSLLENGIERLLEHMI